MCVWGGGGGGVDLTHRICLGYYLVHPVERNETEINQFQSSG